MGRQLRRIELLGVVVLLGVCRVASAAVTTEGTGSILVFPKILADGTRDTIIQISNTSNDFIPLHCFYVNAALADRDRPQSELNQPLWQEIDFDILLTKQQPTYWIVSEGRSVDPRDEPCRPGEPACPNAGFDPGRIPPVVPDFEGELRCYEVDLSGAPMGRNAVKGEAILVREVDGDISSYNAIAIPPDQQPNADPILVLGGGQCTGNSATICESDEDCVSPSTCLLEYEPCPQTWILNHLADGAPNLVLGPTSAVKTELTVVPCTVNYETQIPTKVTLQFVTTNEFESQFSVSTSVTCWGNFGLDQVGATALTFAGQVVPDPQGTMYLQTRIRSAAGTPYGVLMVAEELHQFEGASARAAVNLHMEGRRANPDLITTPGDQIVPEDPLVP